MKSRLPLYFPLFSLCAIAFASGGSQAADFTADTPTQLRIALNAAENNGQPDVIRIGAGTFSTTDGQSAFFYLSPNNEDLTIQGAGRDSTILDGADNLSVLQIIAPGGHLRVADLSIRNGKSPSGSALLLVSNTGRIDINNVEIADSHSASFGAMFLSTQQADVSVKNCVIQNNRSSADTGGFQINGGQGQLTFENNRILNNFTTNGSFGAGDISSTGTNTTILSGNHFEGNTSSKSVGALQVNTVGNILVDGNTFFVNSSGARGGFLISGDQVSLTNNLLDQNNASTWGVGAGLVVGTHVSVINNVVTRNTAASVAGLDIIASETSTLLHNTFAGNRAVTGPAGLELHANGVDTRLHNNIFFDNLTSNLPNDVLILDNNGLNVGNPVAISHNIFEVLNSACQNDNACAPNANVTSSDNFNDDPRFVFLEDGDVHLNSTSPAIDFGDPNVALLPAQDFDGNPRIFNSKPDLGAYETSSRLTVNPTFIDFGNLSLGKESDKTVTLQNKGSTDVSVTGISLDDDNDFLVDTTVGNNACGATSFTLAAGQSCTVQVRFAPDSEGLQDNQLRISSNDATQPSLAVALHGNGKEPGNGNNGDDGDDGGNGGDAGGCSCSFETSATAVHGAWLWILPALSFGFARFRKR